MPFEVELKAWVDDPQTLEAVLQKEYRLVEKYDKKDSYFTLPKNPAFNSRMSLRVRQEKNRVTVTLKEKSVADGIETNREDEFTVSSFMGIKTLLETMGCSCSIEKRKKGKKFQAGDCTIELSNVEKLGWFLEIEKLVSTDDPAVLSRAKSEIRKLLEKAGISEEKIEPRYYTDMLQSKS